MQKVGEVTAVRGDKLEITFCRPQDCEHCHACEGGQERTVIEVDAHQLWAQPGDYAAVELPTGTVIKASLLAYILPLAGLLGGMALGYTFWSGQPGFSALTGLAGLLLCLAAVWLTEKKRASSVSWQPQLIRILPRSVYEEPASAALNNQKGA